MARTFSLFESAVSRMRVMRQGDIVQLVIDGGGALVTSTQDFIQAQKWASSKPASGNMITDRGRMLERLSVLVARPGSVLGTQGNAKQLAGLCKLMSQGGYDLAEWMLPPELKNPQPQAPANKPDPPDAEAGAQTVSTP